MPARRTLLLPLLAWMLAAAAAGGPLLVLHPSEDAAAPRDPPPAGLAVRLHGDGNALAHWLAMRGGDGADFALESVQFAAWRVREQGYRALGASDRAIAYSVVTRRGQTLIEVDDLAELRVAVPPPPSLPALQLLALFPDPLRTPRLVAVDGFEAGLAALRALRVDAVLLPEPLSRVTPDVHEVLTLEELPVAVLTAAPGVSEAEAEAMTARLGAALPALLGAGGLRPAEEDIGWRAALLDGIWRGAPRAAAVHPGL